MVIDCNTTKHGIPPIALSLHEIFQQLRPITFISISSKKHNQLPFSQIKNTLAQTWQNFYFTSSAPSLMASLSRVPMCELQPDLCGGLVVQTLAIVMCGSGDACKPLNGSTMCVYVTCVICS